MQTYKHDKAETLYVNKIVQTCKKKEVIDFCFKGRQSHYIAITKYGVTWVSNINKYAISFDKKSQK